MKRFALYLFGPLSGVGLVAITAFVKAPTQSRWQYHIAQSTKAHTREVQHGAVTRYQDVPDIYVNLDSLGAQGWELVQVVPGGTFIFKRPLS